MSSCGTCTCTKYVQATYQLCVKHLPKDLQHQERFQNPKACTLITNYNVRSPGKIASAPGPSIPQSLATGSPDRKCTKHWQMVFSPRFRTTNRSRLKGPVKEGSSLRLEMSTTCQHAILLIVERATPVKPRSNHDCSLSHRLTSIGFLLTCNSEKKTTETCETQHVSFEMQHFKVTMLPGNPFPVKFPSSLGCF